VSSDGDLVSEERARQLAWETARVLRELERQFADPHNQDDVLPGDFRSMLDSYLQTATELLGTKHPMMSLITNLRAHLVTDHELTLGAVKTRSALIATALETRFNLGTGGGQVDQGFSVTQEPRAAIWRSAWPRA
jgi:hypothetical protein